MAVVDTLLEQALQLPDKERSQLVARLLRSLESTDDEELAPDAWAAAWTHELDERMRDARSGTDLVDGEEVFVAAASRIRSRCP